MKQTVFIILTAFKDTNEIKAINCLSQAGSDCCKPGRGWGRVDYHIKVSCPLPPDHSSISNKINHDGAARGATYCAGARHLYSTWLPPSLSVLSQHPLTSCSPIRYANSLRLGININLMPITTLAGCSGPTAHHGLRSLTTCYIAAQSGDYVFSLDDGRFHFIEHNLRISKSHSTKWVTLSQQH